jgi:hypothetical protein
MALSLVWPSSLPISVNPKGVAPTWMNCFTFLAIRWCLTSSLSSILVQVFSLLLGTSTCINLFLLSVLSLRCPLIWRPIFLHDLCAVFLLSRTLTSFSTNISFSTGSKIPPSLYPGLLFSTIAWATCTSYWPLCSFAFATTSLSFCLEKFNCRIHSWTDNAC